MVGNPPEKKPSAKTFECPHCAGEVIIRAVGHSVAVTCGSCGSLIDATNDNYKLVDAGVKDVQQLLIPLGTRGKLRGETWEVIGYLKRSDASGEYAWSEYLLFNPHLGFRWLTEFDGHWNYVVMLKSPPKAEISFGRNKTVTAPGGKSFMLFHVGHAVVRYVSGEFYWQVRARESVVVEDYIAPPEMLSMESGDGEIVWSRGEYIESTKVKEAFGIKSMPYAHGVAPNQPSTVSSGWQQMKTVWFSAIGILFLLQTLFHILNADKLIYRGDFERSFNDPAPIKTSESFKLDGELKNLEYNLHAPVSNDWLETSVELVNEETGDAIQFEHGVEYYAGSDSDGPWSEGSRSGSIVLSSIPKGTYRLNLEASSGSPKVPYSVLIKRDVPTWMNYFVVSFLVSVFPIFIWWRSRSFEVSRWSTSDFSPYWNGEEEDE